MKDLTKRAAHGKNITNSIHAYPSCHVRLLRITSGASLFATAHWDVPLHYASRKGNLQRSTVRTLLARQHHESRGITH